jgi:RNA polymerase sigma factor (sigma-70 family)
MSAAYPPSMAKEEESNVGRDEVLTKLFETHQRRLFNFVLGKIRDVDEAVDIAQQAFVEAVQSYSSFRGESEMHTWLYGIAMNLVRNHLSRAPRCRFEFETDEALDQYPGTDDDPCDRLSVTQCMDRLQTHFDTLPTELQKTLTLVAFDELSYQDAAGELHIPVGTVRSRLFRCRTILREQLGRDGIAIDV